MQEDPKNRLKEKKIGILYSYIEKVLRCWTHNETEREKNCKEETDFFLKSIIFRFIEIQKKILSKATYVTAYFYLKQANKLQ